MSGANGKTGRNPSPGASSGGPGNSEEGGRAKLGFLHWCKKYPVKALGLITVVVFWALSPLWSDFFGTSSGAVSLACGYPANEIAQGAGSDTEASWVKVVDDLIASNGHCGQFSKRKVKLAIMEELEEIDKAVRDVQVGGGVAAGIAVGLGTIVEGVQATAAAGAFEGAQISKDTAKEIVKQLMETVADTRHRPKGEPTNLVLEEFQDIATTLEKSGWRATVTLREFQKIVDIIKNAQSKGATIVASEIKGIAAGIDGGQTNEPDNAEKTTVTGNLARIADAAESVQTVEIVPLVQSIETTVVLEGTVKAAVVFDEPPTFKMEPTMQTFQANVSVERLTEIADAITAGQTKETADSRAMRGSLAVLTATQSLQNTTAEKGLADIATALDGVQTIRLLPATQTFQASVSVERLMKIADAITAVQTKETADSKVIQESLANLVAVQSLQNAAVTQGFEKVANAIAAAQARASADSRRNTEIAAITSVAQAISAANLREMRGSLADMAATQSIQAVAIKDGLGKVADAIVTHSHEGTNDDNALQELEQRMINMIITCIRAHAECRRICSLPAPLTMEQTGCD